jgi:predicted nucleotide-binding protein
MLLPSEKLELAIYKHVDALEPPVNVSLPQLSQVTGEKDHAKIAERLKALDIENRISLSKYSRGQRSSRGDSPDRAFFHTGSFLIEIAPQGRKYFERLEQESAGDTASVRVTGDNGYREEEESVPQDKVTPVSNSPLMAPQKTIQILTKLINEAAYLTEEAFGALKRKQWESTAHAALERGFANHSSIRRSFRASRSLSYDANASDIQLRNIANKQLSSMIAILQSAVEQLGWEVEDEKSIKQVSATDQESHNPERTPANSRDVFVIHGRDERLRAGMFDFLRSLDLNPMEWSHAVALTGKSAPYIGEILDAAFSQAQAVVVLFSPDDLARLRPELCGASEPPHEVNVTHQARPNVLFEAGMAMARHPDRTVFVEIGVLRPFSDIAGRHTIRMDNSPKKRQEIAQRLQKAGCPVNLSGTDWQTAGDMRLPGLPVSKSVSSELEAISLTKDKEIESLKAEVDSLKHLSYDEEHRRLAEGKVNKLPEESKDLVWFLLHHGKQELEDLRKHCTHDPLFNDAVQRAREAGLVIGTQEGNPARASVLYFWEVNSEFKTVLQDLLGKRAQGFFR